ncbi:hypothetical protein BDP27DRAFT_1429437 [Rhodocollybia butyracea]|uniref:Uncharacterized protein n=1 Tax=Rhodocollybia butyracea TaxID=206335 RepID=A0A9P5PDZ6_9AGAR|nr:hypothetical protein BDP27DRAFT_1429437 [Rhodocollybia butyracea]
MNINTDKKRNTRRNAPRSQCRNLSTTSIPESDDTHNTSATEASVKKPYQSSQTTAQAPPYPIEASGCSGSTLSQPEGSDKPVLLGVPPHPDDPTVRFVTLHDPQTQQPWLVVRLWPMSRSWNDQMYGWFLDILNLQRQMIPPPDDLMMLQASNGFWIEIRTLEYNCRIAWNRAFPSSEEKYFVMEGTRLLLYRSEAVIGEIAIPLHKTHHNTFYKQEFRALHFNHTEGQSEGEELLRGFP